MPGVTIGHAAFVTWDGRVVIFGHEPGGGAPCHDERFFDDAAEGSLPGDPRAVLLGGREVVVRLESALVQPQGLGRWRERGAVLDFFLVCDRAADTPDRISGALAGYEELARANPQLATVILVWTATAEREAEVRRALHPRSCLVATATEQGGCNPAEAVWLPLGASGPRRRLADLARPHCWSSDRG